MAERYKLPDDVLGGGEIEATEFWSGCAGAQAEYELADGYKIVAPKGERLTPVKPPTPEEPTELGLYLVDDEVGTVVERQTDGWWFLGARVFVPAGHLYDKGEPFALVRLVPERVETVELPWTFTDIDGDRVRVTELGHVEFNGSVCVQMTAGARAEMAAALLTASRAES